jgi:hypothetical protein
LIFLTEGLLRKENAVPVKAHAVPTKAQRPTPPRNIISPPPVSAVKPKQAPINAANVRKSFD